MNLAKREYCGLPVIPASAGRLFNTVDNLLRTTLSQLLNPMNPAFLPEPTSICKTILLVYAYRKHLAGWSDPIKGYFSIWVCRHFGYRSEPWQRVSELRSSAHSIRINTDLTFIGSDAQIFNFREKKLQPRL